MYSHVPAQRNRLFQLPDVIVFAIIGLAVYGVVETAQRWNAAFQPAVSMSLAARMVPLYALYSLYRALIAYLLSLGFTLSLGYLAAKNRLAERVIVPLLDIGQSIPVLGFLPALVLGLVAIFPKTNVGLELACITMIFTGQVWNMTFSYISSLKAVPEQLYEMTKNVGLNPLQTWGRLELPCTATGLAWNSLMSMAGGWFFLTVCESFTLGEKSFRLPGLGSYMALAIDKGDTQAMVVGIVAMVIVILLMDFVVWRPIIAWSAKFRLSEARDTPDDIPFMSLLLKRSPVFQNIIDFISYWMKKFSERRRPHGPIEAYIARKPSGKRSRYRRILKVFMASKLFHRLFVFAIVVLGFFVTGKVYTLVDAVGWVDWRDIMVGTCFTFLRVLLALAISSIWAIPAGIYIGLSPKLTRTFQPIIQLGASFPAPMLYPLALGVFAHLGLGLGISSSLLMLLGVQWYVLFNVLAGAIGISDDLRESFYLIGVSRKSRWLKLYLPSVFPSLVTGWVTAAGGAWNASIVAEYIQYHGVTLTTRGLGALISEATSSGNFQKLAACLIVMVVSVVTLNRSVWSRLYTIAETRYRFER